jgi:hypothetical protein
MATAAAAAAAATEAEADLPLEAGHSVSINLSKAAAQHLLIPGLHPLQLAYLVLECMCLLGTSQDSLLSAHTGFPLLLQLLNYAQAQQMEGVSAVEPSVMQQNTQGIVEAIWCSPGKQLQQACGVAEADLEGDGLQLAADEVLAAASYSISGASSRVQDTWRRMLTANLVEKPADPDGKMARSVWSLYGDCLWRALSLYQSECQRVGRRLYMYCCCFVSSAAEGHRVHVQHQHAAYLTDVIPYS